MKIITDSASDIPDSEARELGITIAPLYIRFPEREIGSTELTADEFYDRLRAMAPQIPTTSQPSPGMFAELYQKISSAGEEILSIHISSGLSGTIQAARIAANDLPGAAIRIVDSLTLSGGQRFQVLAAHMAAKIGWGTDAIVALLERVRAATETIYTLETIEYLARGGRIGRIQAIAGSMLGIKPIIRVDKADGKYSSAGRGRTLRQTMDGIVQYLAKTYGTEDPLWITVMHGQIPDIATAFAETLRQRLSVGRLDILRVSPALGVHVGPGVVGAAVIPLSVMEGLL
jgi:DegV family protein with EDD domain